MATTQEGKQTSAQGMSTEDLRAKMCRLIDELASARSDRAAALKTEFEALWKTMPGVEEPTIH